MANDAQIFLEALTDAILTMEDDEIEILLQRFSELFDARFNAVYDESGPPEKSTANALARSMRRLLEWKSTDFDLSGDQSD